MSVIINKNPEFCVNCAQPFSLTHVKIEYVTHPIFDTHHAINNERRATTTSSVGSVLTSIYKLQLHVEDEDEFKFNYAACCVHCAAILTSLYQLYVEFDRLRHVQSVLSKALAKTVSVPIVSVDSLISEEEWDGQDQEDICSNASSSPIQNFNKSDDDSPLQNSSSPNLNVEASSIITWNKNSSTESKTEDSSSSPRLSFGPWVKLERLKPQDWKQAGREAATAASSSSSTTTTTTTFQENPTSNKNSYTTTPPHLPPDSPCETIKGEDTDSNHEDHRNRQDDDDDFKPDVDDDDDDDDFKPDVDDDDDDDDFKPDVDDEDWQDGHKSDLVSKTKVKRKRTKKPTSMILEVRTAGPGTVTSIPPGIRLSCALCPRRTYTMINLYKHHMRTVHHQNLEKCPHCDQSFALFRDLRAHQERDHVAEYPWHVCGECGKKYLRRNSLMQHLRERHKSPKYKRKKRNKGEEMECLCCSAKFENHHQWKNHMSSCHPEHVQQHACSLCSKVLSSKSSLDRHVELHSTAKPFSCPQCERSFPNETYLRKHLKVHSDIMDHLCPQCGRRFRQPGSLRSHLLLHTNEKPYECKTCHQFFRHRSGLKNHEESHLEGKTHLCPLCGMSFTHKKNLLVHASVHSDDKPYKCPVPGCGRAYKSTANLGKHKKAHEKTMTPRTEESGTPNFMIE